MTEDAAVMIACKHDFRPVFGVVMGEGGSNRVIVVCRWCGGWREAQRMQS